MRAEPMVWREKAKAECLERRSPELHALIETWLGTQCFLHFLYNVC
jgi:hypothetical protein